MMSGPHLRIVTPEITIVTERHRQPVRLKLKPKASATGYVDGAWWPRTWDLSVELPALLVVLAVRLGHIRRVSYNLGTWETAPRRLPIGDGPPVRLGGFNFQHPYTIDVIAPNGPTLTLLVVPPAANPATAHRILMMAGRRDNVDSVDELLMATAEPSPATGDLPDAAAVETWETEGGPVYQRA
jgi:hypothetical protein